jgi:hypothetical protein
LRALLGREGPRASAFGGRRHRQQARRGASIGADYVAKAKPDGYTWPLGCRCRHEQSILRADMPYADGDLRRRA